MGEWTTERALTITLPKEDWEALEAMAEEDGSPLELFVAGLLGRIARDHQAERG